MLPQTSAGFKERKLEEIKDGGRKRRGSEEPEVPSTNQQDKGKGKVCHAPRGVQAGCSPTFLRP